MLIRTSKGGGLPTPLTQQRVCRTREVTGAHPGASPDQGVDPGIDGDNRPRNRGIVWCLGTKDMS